MTSSEIRHKFLTFFASRKHAILPSASLVPENDPSVLFNTAGMQPLVPYLMGQKHPSGNRLASCQKCVRTGDLEDIGDNRHFSFFEMLGNWSLGDYFKKEAITWSYEFLTSREEGLGSVITPDKLFITIFEGDENAPLDEESKKIWMSLGIPEHRIYTLPADDNWWSPGDNGPSGPCTEMFFDMESQFVGQELSKERFTTEVKKENIIEIWNDVFMEYEKKNGKVIGKLVQHNVDTGAGLERLTAVMQGKKTAYETDIFEQVVQYINVNSSKECNDKSVRVICDHIRTAAFMIADGVVPSNKDQGYILRRLIRRAFVQADKIGLSYGILVSLRGQFATQYENVYPELKKDSIAQHDVFKDEIEKFKKTLHLGLHEFEKGNRDAFTLFTTYGFPLELTQELATEQGEEINLDDFYAKMEEHQNLSRAGAEQKFKGGLADHSEATVKLHTAHHLLLAALQKHVSPDIHQRGSNITAERLRMDFNLDRKLTDEEKKTVENQVNEWIGMNLPVERREMQRTEAEALGAEMEFGAKYPDMVSVYVIEAPDHTFISKEFCGGPHITNTGKLGHFVLQKEEASSAGIRRLKAILN